MTSSWTDPIVDEEYNLQVKGFLEQLKSNMQTLTLWPRRLVPTDYKPVGSVFLSSAVMFIISGPKYTIATKDNSEAIHTDALSKIKHHSIPSNESLGASEGVEMVVNYAFNHASILFKHQDPDQPFLINLGIDSTCFLHSLSPTKFYKSILLKNVTQKIHTLLCDLTAEFPFVIVKVYYIESEKNVSDPNSKIPSNFDAIAIIESDIWHHGIPEFKDKDFPTPGRVFLSFKEGNLLWTQTEIEPSN